MPCPLGGLRAAELAAGEWRSLFHELADIYVQEILASAAFVDMQDMFKVTQDWGAGQDNNLRSAGVEVAILGEFAMDLCRACPQ